MSRKRLWILGIAMLAVVGVLTAALCLQARARVVGATSAQRVASIARIADDRPFGAAEAISAAAVDEADAGVRRAALIALRSFDAPPHRATAERALSDASPEVRAEAAWLLGRYADPAAADRLNELAGGDPAEAVRLAAVAALSRAGAGVAIVHLVEIAERPGNARMQAGAMQAVCRRFGVPRTFDPAEKADWPNDLEVIKSWPQVRAAFDAAARPLNRHPERLTSMPH